MSDGNPLVSVVMPTYNAEETIGEALDSLLPADMDGLGTGRCG